MTEILIDQAHRVSAAELDLMCQGAADFLHSQGMTSRNSYVWPPDRMHMDGGVAADFRVLAAPSRPAWQPALSIPSAQGELANGISAAELACMHQAAAGFLKSQGTAARDEYYWPRPGVPHAIEAMGDFRDLVAHRGQA